jgi:ribosome biogenesis GTPase
MQERLENGLVVRVTGGEVWVRVGRATVACSLRGRLRIRPDSPPVVAGDRVTILREGKEAASLEAVLPRSSWLSRYVERGAAERVVVANVDRLFAVVSVAEPPLRTAFLDRVLAAAEWGHVTPCIVLNKIDLARTPEQHAQVDGFHACYAPSGYEVVATCAVTGRGMDALEQRVGQGVYAFVGESGVGKTSLVNRLDPELDLRVQSIGERTGRGRHTTSNSQLFPFRHGFLADTPGMQTFGFPGVDPGALAACFPDLARVPDPCRFQPCTHSHEPGCGVKAAVEAGRVPPSRYQSYLDILDGIRQRVKKKSW